MKGYQQYVLELDGVGRFFASRARKLFIKNLGKDTQVTAIIQGKGVRGQEVWLCTAKKVAFVRVGLLTRQYSELRLDQIASYASTRERMFTRVRMETEEGPRQLSQVKHEAARRFEQNLQGALP